MNDFGFFPMMGSPIAGPLMQEAILPTGQMPEEGFVDLLNLVEDVSLADQASGELPQLLESELAPLKQADHEQLKAEWSAPVQLDSNAFLASSMAFAQAKPVEQAPVSFSPQLSQAASSLQLDILPSESPLSMAASSTVASAAPLKSEAVAAWGHAFAQGDIKGLSLEAPKLSLFEQKILHAQTKPESSEELIQEVATQKLAPETGAAAKITHKAVEATRESASFQPAAHAAQVPVQKMPAPRTKVANASAAPEDASSFLLKQAGAAPLASTSLGTSEALQAPDTLGQSPDRRISPEALTFVSNQIDALRARGGGQLKVELNPQELGSIDITVRKQGNKLNVEIHVEKADTLQLLKQDEASLGTLLNRNSKVELSMEHKSSMLHSEKLAAPMAGVASEHRVVATPVKHESSLDHLDLLNQNSFDVPDIASTQSSDSNTSSDSGSFSRGQSQESRSSENNFAEDRSSRDEAMLRWEKLWRERQTA
jgi:flagellar hook-length control protein FliK